MSSIKRFLATYGYANAPYTFLARLEDFKQAVSVDMAAGAPFPAIQDVASAATLAYQGVDPSAVEKHAAYALDYEFMRSFAVNYEPEDVQTAFLEVAPTQFTLYVSDFYGHPQEFLVDMVSNVFEAAVSKPFEMSMLLLEWTSSVRINIMPANGNPILFHVAEAVRQILKDKDATPQFDVRDPAHISISGHRGWGALIASGKNRALLKRVFVRTIRSKVRPSGSPRRLSERWAARLSLNEWVELAASGGFDKDVADLLLATNMSQEPAVSAQRFLRAVPAQLSQSRLVEVLRLFDPYHPESAASFAVVKTPRGTYAHAVEHLPFEDQALLLKAFELESLDKQRFDAKMVELGITPDSDILKAVMMTSIDVATIPAMLEAFRVDDVEGTYSEEAFAAWWRLLDLGFKIPEILSLCDATGLEFESLRTLADSGLSSEEIVMISRDTL